jgi:hypothetical protein
MTNPAPVNASASTVEAYEKLRGYALTGKSPGGAEGLIILLRQGLAAWMSRLSTCFDSAKSDSSPVAPLVADELHSAFVRVLASMALGGQQEVQV